jgi:hypothetical protein
MQPMQPDWSWQHVAVDRCLASLSSAPAEKVGLVVPTGGGKTRIALRVAMEWLAQTAKPDAQVLWVTHREHLREAALRTLDSIAQDEQTADDPQADRLRRTFAERIQFVLVQSITPMLAALGDDLGLVIVDEAHHAAADSYKVVLDLPIPGLFLTATPNRADGLPIGIDQIAYTTTYRELFKRGCVVEPEFHPPIDLAGLDWTSPAGLRPLADVILDGSEKQFAKVLVAVTQQDRAQMLHAALQVALDDREEHPLAADDIAYVHGLSNSAGLPTSAFLELFAVKRRGVLVGTSQLIGEGFDNPFIDTVVTTYPSTSISHLMQVAGRAMRSSPGKRSAHVLQVHESALEYHFEQRWLYQDISDRWHPAIVDWKFATPRERDQRIQQLLIDHHVSAPVTARIIAQLETLDASEEVQLMLLGQHYFGDPAAFEVDSAWGAILVSSRTRSTFVDLFNRISDRDEDIKDDSAFVNQFLSKDVSPGSEFKSYVDLIGAVEYARRELQRESAAGQDRRPFHARRSSTWLRYHVFGFEPQVPLDLERFLEGAVNKNEVVDAYSRQPQGWTAALRVSLPVEGWFAWLLDAESNAWFEANVADVRGEVQREVVSDRFAVLSSWRHGLRSVPLPPIIIERFDELTRDGDRDKFFLSL